MWATGLAFPGAVGSCAAGTEALLQTKSPSEQLKTHGTLNQVGGGPLTDFNLSLEFDGLVLEPGRSLDFETGTDHTLSLIASGDSFGGFLIRMESVDGTRTLDALLPIEIMDPNTNETGTGGVKVPSECLVEFVAGVSHVNAERRQHIDVNLYMETPTEGLLLDVTVVVETSIARNVSHWYYSQYTLNAVRPEGQPTAAPITTPVPTAALSSEPSENPTISSSDDSSGSTVTTILTVVAHLIPLGTMTCFLG